jgi:hypothetical protein
MRDSADSDDYGVTRRGRKRGTFHDDEAAYAKRDRHLPRLKAEDANDGLAEGDRWTTWGQSEDWFPTWELAVQITYVRLTDPVDPVLGEVDRFGRTSVSLSRG